MYLFHENTYYRNYGIQHIFFTILIIACHVILHKQIFSLRQVVKGDVY